MAKMAKNGQKWPKSSFFGQYECPFFRKSPDFHPFGPLPGPNNNGQIRIGPFGFCQKWPKMSPKIGFLGFSRGQKTGQAPTKLMFFAKNAKNVIFCVCQDRRPFLRNKSRKKHEKRVILTDF
jgi:hypothetical protein